MTHSLPTCLGAVCVLALSLSAQLQFEEVLVDPKGTNAGKQIVEIVNTSSRAFTPKGWQLCIPFSYAAFPAIAIPAGGVVQLHIAAKGTNSKTDFYFPLIRSLGTKDTILIYKSAIFSNSNDIIDFMSFGGGTARIAQAVGVKLWPSATATVAVPKVEGRSLARFGTVKGPEAWYEDASPTLGTSNGAGAISRLGKGCATSTGVPALGFSSPGVDGNMSFRVQSTGGPKNGVALILLGTKSLGGVPVLGCPLEILPDILALPVPTDANSQARLPLPLYNGGTSVKGIQIFFQAAVFDLSATNKIFGMTPGLSLKIGS